jgi:hypothetical protein
LVGYHEFKGFQAVLDNIFECVCCYKHCHGIAFKEFVVLCLLSLCWLVDDHLILKDFGPYWMLFMTAFVALDFSVVLDG